jgi:hypothetical protein
MNRSAEVAIQQLDGGHAGCPVCEAAVRAGDFVVPQPIPDIEVAGRLVLLRAGLEVLQAIGGSPTDGKAGLSRPSSFAA